jgi:starvation-inducible DNA-binding protein
MISYLNNKLAKEDFFMGKNYIGLEKEGLEGVVRELNKYLGNLNVIYTKLHNLHWNIKGAAFFELL